MNHNHAIRAFYEIATSIGASIDLKVMAKAALNAYYRKLHLKTASLVQLTSDGPVLLQSCGQNSKTHQVLLDRIAAEGLSGLGHLLFKIRHTDEGDESDHIDAVYELPHFGALILTYDQSNAMMDDSIIEQDLIILNQNFAASCIACFKNHELQQAELAAQKALQIKTHFLSHVSYELRTPMNAIIGFANLLLRNSKPEKSPEYSQRILDSANLLMSMINDMLDLNNYEFYDHQKKHLTFNLKTEMKRMMEPLQKFSELKGIDLKVVIIDGTHLEIATDLKRLTQVICKIVDNSVKFCSNGDSILVQCSVDSVEQKSHERTQHSLHVQVIDTGPGIPVQCHQEVFEPFQSGFNHISKKYQGPGLGLPVCKKVVTQMGGKIRLRQPEQGCHIEFTWPCALNGHNIKEGKRDGSGTLQDRS